MYKLNQLLKDKLWFLFDSEKCELCHGKLRRRGDLYYGGVDVYDTIEPSKKRTAYLCNLCYQLFKNES
jgi:hypothetical protein